MNSPLGEPVSSTDSTGALSKIWSAARAPVSAEGGGAAGLLRRRNQRGNAPADATAGALDLNGPPSSPISLDLLSATHPARRPTPPNSAPLNGPNPGPAGHAGNPLHRLIASQRSLLQSHESLQPPLRPKSCPSWARSSLPE